MRSRDGGTHKKRKINTNQPMFSPPSHCLELLGGSLLSSDTGLIRRQLAPGRNLELCARLPLPPSGWVSSCPVLLESPLRLGLHQGAGSLLGVNPLFGLSPPLLALGCDLTWPVQPCVLAAALGENGGHSGRLFLE